MPAIHTAGSMRLPNEPYPGLRPFLDFEAALLFGRERQVREVIERLRVSQFVAVLGGSGSGKSSLIHAGVTPELRSYGIPGAGDLWLTMVCTPGTNVSQADRSTRRRSPITRLARRFGALLNSRGSLEADALRELEIAEVFRQEAGFARLLDTFGAELAVPPGPDVADARVLFVLDQFEEIFHPTNQGVDDARLLVERVLDHFFNPHPRCHVVITMRSEHLNDCAAFLELPDAINKSSYLVRRLDEEELQQAITGPAQRFLRLVARNSDEPERLPASVQFEVGVVDRLVADARAIARDPDHLPLLQHLLARLWQAALAREATGLPVPAHIVTVDLIRAVHAGTTATAAGQELLPASLNTLRASVDNWPAAILAQHTAAQRGQLDAVFRQLAFKDPNTGLYSQQRIDIDATAAALVLTRLQLRALLGEGFLGNVDYLYWDDDDAERLTLKVSHESFIRGWSHFRRLIDEQSQQFDEFLGVLRRADEWQASQRADDLLLQPGEIRRLREGGFEARLAEPGRREAWFRLLRLVRDGERLAGLGPVLETLLAVSSQRQLDSQRRHRRNRGLAVAMVVAALLLLPPTLFSLFVQAPVIDRAGLLFAAGNRANRAPLSPDYPGVGAADATMASLLRAAELVDQARSGSASPMAGVSQWLIDRFSWLGPVRSQDNFLKGVAAQAEPPVNGKLRLLFSSAVWHGRGPLPAGDAMPMARVDDRAQCAAADDDTGMTLAEGKLFVSEGRDGQGSTLRRAVFLPRAEGDAKAGVVLRSATFDRDSRRCVYGPIVLAIPGYLNPYLVFDAGLRYFLYTAYGSNVDAASVTVHEIDWDRNESGQVRVLQSEVRAVVTSSSAVAALIQAAGTARVGVVPSWRVTGGRVLDVQGELWRLVAPQAQRLVQVGVADGLQPLPLSPPSSSCRLLAAPWAQQSGALSEWRELDPAAPGGRHCFLVTRIPLAEGAARQDTMVAVYDRPVRSSTAGDAGDEPAPIASLGPFARLSPQDADFHVGVGGPHAGWLALKRDDRFIGAPYSSCALWRLGRELATAAPAAAVQPPVCQHE